MYDENKDGKITRDELKRVFEKMGKEPTEKDLDDWIASVDQNGEPNTEISRLARQGMACSIVVRASAYGY